MQSFHPEKYPASKTQAGTQTEHDHPKEAGAEASASQRGAPAEKER